MAELIEEIPEQLIKMWDALSCLTHEFSQRLLLTIGWILPTDEGVAFLGWDKEEMDRAEWFTKLAWGEDYQSERYLENERFGNANKVSQIRDWLIPEINDCIDDLSQFSHFPSDLVTRLRALTSNIDKSVSKHNYRIGKLAAELVAVQDELHNFILTEYPKHLGKYGAFFLWLLGGAASAEFCRNPKKVFQDFLDHYELKFTMDEDSVIHLGSTRYTPENCPDCGAKRKVASTRAATRIIKCGSCGRLWTVLRKDVAC